MLAVRLCQAGLRYVAWLDGVSIQFDLSPVNLVGHSMGALITGSCSITPPDQVARVELLSGVFRCASEARQAVEARADDILNGQFDLETPLARWCGALAFEQEVCKQVSGWICHGLVPVSFEQCLL